VSTDRRDRIEERFRRRALRIVASLSGGGRLVRREGGNGALPCYELHVSGERAPRLVAEAGTVEEMRRRDWLCKSPDSGVTASEAGRAALARERGGRDGFRAQHLELSPPGKRDVAPDAAAIVDNESPLARLRRRRDTTGQPLISEAQYMAGERLRADFTRARMTPRITMDWSGAVARGGRGARRGGPASLLDDALAARARVEQALRATGPALDSVLLDVCCFLVGLEDVERARRWPRRSAKVVLQIALDRLAAHYGLSEAARGRGKEGHIRHWGAGDYRPRTQI
jgi:hypothetical protein